MNFIFSRQKEIFYSLAALVRKILFCHSKIKFISSRHRVISSIRIQRVPAHSTDQIPTEEYLTTLAATEQIC